MNEIELTTSFKINEDFLYKLAEGKISFTSVLPDMYEIYIFEGVSARVLHDWFNSKDVMLDKSFWENKYQTPLNEEDWKRFVEFVINKKLILNKP